MNVGTLGSVTSNGDTVITRHVGRLSSRNLSLTTGTMTTQRDPRLFYDAAIDKYVVLCLEHTYRQSYKSKRCAIDAFNGHVKIEHYKQTQEGAVIPALNDLLATAS